MTNVINKPKPARIKSWKAGELNRGIEENVRGAITGEPGAAGRAMDLARKREKLILYWSTQRKTA